jgi:hypothetical protein
VHRGHVAAVLVLLAGVGVAGLSVEVAGRAEVPGQGTPQRADCEAQARSMRWEESPNGWLAQKRWVDACVARVGPENLREVTPENGAVPQGVQSTR